MSDSSTSNLRQEASSTARSDQAHGQGVENRVLPTYEETLGLPSTAPPHVPDAYRDPYSAIEFPPEPPPYQSVYPSEFGAHPLPYSVQFPSNQQSTGHIPFYPGSAPDAVPPYEGYDGGIPYPHPLSPHATPYPLAKARKGSPSTTTESDQDTTDDVDDATSGGESQRSTQETATTPPPRQTEDEEDLPPLPTKVQGFIRAGVICCIGLIVIGGLGFAYNVWAYRVGAGAWCGLLTLVVFVGCNDPRSHQNGDRRRFIFVIFNVMAFILGLFFIVWHGIGLSVDNTYFKVCNFEASFVKNCTEFDWEKAVYSYVVEPQSYRNIQARVIIQAVGIILAVAIILSRSCIYHHTKTLPGKVSPLTN
jgi:hypothetical protein